MASFRRELRTGPVEPYTALATVYDLVMEHVDYAEWAEFVDFLMTVHCPEAKEVLEFGCGTGSLALELCEIRPLAYVATDSSEEMIRAAESKADGSPIQFLVADLRAISLGREFDVALLLYDGINYLLEEDDIRHSFSRVRRHIRRGGVFIFDQSTPANSLNNQESFEDSGQSEGVEFVRQSRYDEATKLHHTSFEIVIDGCSYSEQHVQRAYSVEDMRGLIPQTEWSVEAALDGFTQQPATDASERVHWILRAR